MAGLQVLADTRRGQLEETLAALEKAWLEAEVLKAQVEDTQTMLKSSKAQEHEVEDAQKKVLRKNGWFPSFSPRSLNRPCNTEPTPSSKLDSICAPSSFRRPVSYLWTRRTFLILINSFPISRLSRLPMKSQALGTKS